MLKKVLLVMALSTPAFADTGFPYTINVTETDHSPQCQVGQLQFSTGTVTCAGQVAKINTFGSGGGGGGGSFLTCGSNPIGLQLSDSASCTWCATIAPAGNLITTLISCPTPQVYIPCIVGQPIGLTLAFVCSR